MCTQVCMNTVRGRSNQPVDHLIYSPICRCLLLESSEDAQSFQVMSGARSFFLLSFFVNSAAFPQFSSFPGVGIQNEKNSCGIVALLYAGLRQLFLRNDEDLGNDTHMHCMHHGQTGWKPWPSVTGQRLELLLFLCLSV